MHDLPPLNRVPHAHAEPVHSPFDALRLVWSLIDPTFRHQTLAMALDDEQCVHGMLLVNDTVDPRSFLAVVDSVVESAVVNPELAALIVVTVRPGGGFDVDDLERWHDADETCDHAGVELIEWFVVGTSTSCPRELCGVLPRWEPRTPTK